MSVSRHPNGRHPAAEHGTISVDNLECKIIVMSFYSKLQRVTTSAFPHTIVDQFSHRLATALSPEELALFCLACPQLGFNLTEDWKTDPDHDRWKYMRGFVMDGNFSAEHLKMRNPWDDVVLTEGAQYMVSDTLYKQHLEEAKEAKERSTCSNHQVVNQANADQHNLEATSIGATACAKHGCFCPHAVVDFQKGERGGTGGWKGHRNPLGTSEPDFGQHLDYGHLLSARDTRCPYVRFQLEEIDPNHSIDLQETPHQMELAGGKTKMLGKAAYQLQLTEAERENVPRVFRGMAAWLATSIKIQEAQIATFNQEAIRYIREIEQAEEWEDISGNKIQDPMSDDEDDADGTPDPADNIGENTDEEDVAKSVIAKKICLSLPSTFSTDKCIELGLQALAKQELEL
ncbi:hypothetical protein EW146_g9246 [Bondarzewia mesenterica]|uniref:CxC2-like cysteine cluster KDZ transposase-associated domain-containing protein n=1 Tax=Bondarzewia mesenterica TaxID=1095465 RepID=A0A4S4L843_9AGAM|nr:hypothetical protein EW146_g9246 [Bondarzewia mesenterica]